MSDELLLTQSAEKLAALKTAISSVVVGQEELIEIMISTLLARGHILLEGVPGVAKSLVVETFAKVFGGSFNRFQFTPDKMPGDILGSMVFKTKEEIFSYRKGPIFCNFFLADEINRASPKVQSALLQAMQERAVSVEEKHLPVPQPFMVLATQNPIEQVGTYPLAEAQIDRFMVKFKVKYLSRDDELLLLQRKNGDFEQRVEKLVSHFSASEIVALQKQVHDLVKVSDTVMQYILNLVLASRPRPVGEEGFLTGVHDYLRLGASPRAPELLLALAKAQAFCRGRDYVDFSDVEKLLPHVLRHRLLLNSRALTENLTPETLIERLLGMVKAY
ncbi:MAG: MoxR family ATPase [Deltaproteobacteria bacterium]|nr:MoxR family ATPase [Candidatus Tharpella sp.]